MNIKKSYKILIDSILEDVRKYRIDNNWNDNQIVLISFDFLFKKILKNNDKIDVCKYFLSINPVKYGFKGIFYKCNDNVDVGIFKKIKNQKLNNGIKINTQYVFPYVYNKIKKINKFLFREIGKKFLIQSGYRSPAYQLIVFFWNLRDSNYNFDYVVKKVALPFYSEHGFVNGQAIDIISMDALNLFDRGMLEKTIEYKWLKENGEYFDFYESYPKNNNMGIIYEPWHWHFKK